MDLSKLNDDDYIYKCFMGGIRIIPCASLLKLPAIEAAREEFSCDESPIDMCAYCNGPARVNKMGEEIKEVFIISENDKLTPSAS